MYVFVREDLSNPQQAVQSCHACIEAATAFNFESLPDHPSVIICGAKNESKLIQIRNYLSQNGIKFVHFNEADLNDELTALATEPICGLRRKLLRKFQLIKCKPTIAKPTAENIQYAIKYPDGYYRWAGECSRSPDRTHYLEDANLFSSEESAKCHTYKDGLVVPVRVCYYEGGAK